MTMWPHIRLAARLVALVPFTAVFYCLRLLTFPLALLSKSCERKVRRSLFKTWGKGVAAIAGMRVRLRGIPPDPPFLLVSNHLSLVDIVVFASCTGEVFVSKSEVKHWPVIGYLARSTNTIFIDRERLRDTLWANKRIGQALDDGHGVHVFAEGGVSGDGALHPFKSALLESAVIRDLPVYYATIAYRTFAGSPPASETIVWRPTVSFARSVAKTLKLPAFEVIVVFGNEPVSAPNRKDLAQRLREAVQEHLIPTP